MVFARVLITLAIAWKAVAADETPQDRIEDLALAIKKGDARAALEIFDPQTPGFAEIKRNVEALSELPDTTCAIAIAQTRQPGGANAGMVEFETDWTLRTYSKQNGPPVERSDRVRISLRRDNSGNSWKITAFSLPSVFAPPDGAIFKRIADLATDLNEKDQTDALGAFDPQMKQYGEIDNDIDALVTQNDVLCAIDIVSDRQTGDVHTLDLDWYLDLKSRTDGGPATQRRERVRVTLRQIKGKWRISSLDPLSILSPLIVR